MKKITVLTLTFVLILSLFCGCSSKKSEKTVDNVKKDSVSQKSTDDKKQLTNQNETDKRTIDDFKKAFTSQNLTLEDEDKPYYEMVGAVNGTSFYINDEVVKIYEYKSTDDLKAAQKKYELTEGFTSNGKFLLESSYDKAITIFKNVAK